MLVRRGASRIRGSTREIFAHLRLVVLLRSACLLGSDFSG